MAAKNGFYGGNPDEVAEAPVTTVLNILRYQKFEADMKMTSLELARDAPAMISEVKIKSADYYDTFQAQISSEEQSVDTFDLNLEED